jgi:hypothetical protein
MPSSPFDSLASLRAAFVAGLEALLEDEGVGAYILVRANAGFDPQIQELLGGRLARRYRLLAARCRELLALGEEPPDAPDDLLVFLKLMALGGGDIGVTELRTSGPWELQFNPLRAFRPKRMSAGSGRGIQTPFRPDGFHFHKPFLRRETFWHGRLLGRELDLLYNKFPFMDMHGLLVPECQAGLPQLLTRDWHHYVWQLAEELGGGLPGVGFGYNAYGAYASVNHLHFQMFVRSWPLPVSQPDWRHNGGERSYPALCRVFERTDSAWEYIDLLHHQETSYNLVYLPGRLYCLPRARQGSYRSARWAAGHAWYEMAGGVVSFRRSDFERLSAADVEAELRRVGKGAAD